MRVLLSGIMGATLSLLGFSFLTWQFWLIMTLFFVFGIVNLLEGSKE